MPYPGAALRVTLYEGLRRIDEDLADTVQARGCPHCGSPLDSSCWQRKPRGLPSKVAWWRLGLCCRQEGCRKRVLPPSALFLGRKVYFAAVILISVASRQRRVTGATADELRAMFGMCAATLKRWISFFRHDLPATASWKVLRSRVSADVADARLPDALLAEFDRLHGPGEAAARACLTTLARAALQAL